MSAAGQVLDPSGIVASTGGPDGDYHPRVGSDGADYLIAWERSPGFGIAGRVQGPRERQAGQVLDPNAFVRSPPRPRNQQRPVVASNQQGYFVAWLDFGANAVKGTIVTQAGVVATPGGAAVGPGPLPLVDPISAASDGTGYLVAWSTDTNQILAAAITPGGAPIGGVLTIESDGRDDHRAGRSRRAATATGSSCTPSSSTWRRSRPTAWRPRCSRAT